MGALKYPLCKRPTEGGSGGREVRGREGACGEAAGIERAAGVETEPAHPKQPCPNEAEDDVMGRHWFGWKSDALAEDERADQR